MQKIDLESIKNYWCYEDIKKNNNINIKELKDRIRVNIYDKYGVNATFYIKQYNYNFDSFSISGFNVFDKDINITEELEFTDSINDCIKGVLYYFNTRY